MKNRKKEVDYAYKISSKILELFEDEDNYFVDIESEDFDMTAFTHAMATIAPNLIFTKLTRSEQNNLEFNHIANQLCFQYSNIESNE
jgi:hypothetical protein